MPQSRASTCSGGLGGPDWLGGMNVAAGRLVPYCPVTLTCWFGPPLTLREKDRVPENT
ncbi:hypothetical protein AB0F96_09410 [Streptomyces sp. NPDC023998]|uniref:hypothetical protein n=1 Tax=Streptomyces sp. NPDC023998 TaxID=3154597 RepID=UPI0033F91BBB